MDNRYTYVTCVTCGEQYQHTDFRCARHLLICAHPLRALPMAHCILAAGPL